MSTNLNLRKEKWTNYVSVGEWETNILQKIIWSDSSIQCQLLDTLDYSALLNFYRYLWAVVQKSGN